GLWVWRAAGGWRTTAGVPVRLASFCRRGRYHGTLAGVGLARLDLRQSYLRARRRMIWLNLGSLTFSAACEAESHLTTRSCFSGHCLLWRVTSSANTRT